ncbi:hypothetical protein Tco_0167631 [Tanacetum coccineum]
MMILMMSHLTSGKNIKDSKILLMNRSSESNNVLLFPECDSVFYEDFSKVDALPSTDNEDKVFNPGSLVVSFPSGTRNKIFDPRIFIGVQSMIFLSPDEFSFSFIRDPPLPVIDTLLPFSSKNENKVVNTGILASEEKSPPSSS